MLAPGPRPKFTTSADAACTLFMDVDKVRILDRTNKTKFRDHVLAPLLNAGLVEMTIPEKPRSSKQKYRLTRQGLSFLDRLEEESP